MTDAFILDHVRTPRGRGRADGSLHHITPIQLAAQTLAAIRDRNALDTRALELFLLNRVLTADEALAWGLVNQVVEDAEVLAQSHALAARLAAGPTEAYGAVKRLMTTSEPGLEQQMASEGRAIAAQATHPQGREGIAAFLDKRKPSFT